METGVQKYPEPALKDLLSDPVMLAVLKRDGLDSLGRRAFDILWDETGVRSGKAEWISADLDAVDILKVIVATYWPVDDALVKSLY